MIVRKQADGTMLLLAQTDHSRLAGMFAAHWGNDQFAPLRPYESVTRAATFHDFGYLRYETAPAFDPKSGETLMFRNVLTDETRLEEYQWCFEWLLAPDPYAGMLVSMHRTGLWRQRYQTIASAKHQVKRQKPEVDAFVERYEAERAATVARHGWDAAELWTNYRLLQAWDLMSLYFSCQEPYEEIIEPVPLSYADKDGEGVRMTLTPVDPSTVAVDPYPFDVDVLEVALPVKRFKSSTFADQDAFRKAYFQAPLDLLTFRLVAAGARPTEREPVLAGARPS